MLSLLIASLLTFILSYILPFKTAFYIVFASLLAVSAVVARKAKIEGDEKIFLVVYAFFILLRFLDPTILDAEKFMDSAFMNAVLKAKSLPPNDPFFAGGKLNFYYYFGHVIAACITLMSFAPPEVGYNIAVAALPSYSALLIYGILKKRSKLAYAGIALTIFSGNLYSVVDFISRIATQKAIDGSYYWNATRVIAGTINEFPYFSFIHADLHAHVAAIPLKILIIAILYRIWEGDRKYLPTLPISLFAVFATNSWDYPLMMLACLAAAVAMRNKEVLLASLASIPFVGALYLTMNVAAAKIGFVAEKSDAIQFIMYAAFPITLAYIFAPNKKVIVITSPISIPAYFISPVLAFLLPLSISSAYSVYKRDFTAALTLAGCAAFILPEFVAIESRMNTVFKFYLVGWLMLTIPAAMNFEWSKRHVIVAMLALSLVYPIVATPVRYSHTELTLDGMIFMKHMAGDYYAIKWLQNKDGVVIEEGCTRGALCAYKYGGRVAAFTGNPAVIAWTNHEYVWRRDYQKIAERARDVRTFYKTDSCEVMRKIIEKYNVSYIFVGYEEKIVFNVTPSKFERCFVKVYEKDGTAIFSTRDRRGA